MIFGDNIDKILGIVRHEIDIDSKSIFNVQRNSLTAVSLDVKY